MSEIVDRLRKGPAPLADPDLNDEAAKAIETQAEKIRVLREALCRIVNGADSLPDFGRNDTAMWLQLEIHAVREVLEKTK